MAPDRGEVYDELGAITLLVRRFSRQVATPFNDRSVYRKRNTVMTGDKIVAIYRSIYLIV